MKTLTHGVNVALAAVSASAMLLAATSGARAQPADTVNVYTTREKDLIEPLLRVFESLTRVKLNVVYLTTDPIAKLTADAASGKVDLFIAAEFSQLVAAKAAGLTEPVTNADVVGRVPENYRDAEGHWFGLSGRVRVVAPSIDRVKQKSFTYEDLADPQWKGKLCVRSGLHPYNVTLVASMIAHKGAPFAETWLRGMKANLSGKPTGGDRDQVAGVQAGRCDIALVNTYYVGGLRSAKDNPQQQAAGNAVNVLFPNQTDRGAHVSISGMAMMKGAPGINNAALLMDFMTSEPAQYVYAQDNYEYPIREGVQWSGLVESWGKPKLDEIPLSELAKLQPQAIELINKVGFDAGS